MRHTELNICVGANGTESHYDVPAWLVWCVRRLLRTHRILQRWQSRVNA